MTNLAREAHRDDARRKFREKYRAQIHPRYSPFFHLGFMLFWGVGFITLAAGRITDMGALEWAALGVTVIAYNFAGEYAMHRWAGHKKTKLLKFVYQRHTGDHHTFFDEDHMEYEALRDWRVVLFPLQLILTATVLMATPAGFLASLVLGPDVGYAVAAGVLGSYLFYEICHFSYHLKEGSALERMFRLIPGWRQIKHIHVLHHTRDVMHDVNFNVTLPIFDVLLGTLYWKPLDQYEQDRAAHLSRESKRLAAGLAAE